MTWAPVAAVIFDWGGTLTPWNPQDPVAGWLAYAAAAHPDDPDRATELATAAVRAEQLRWAASRDEHLAFTVAQVLDDAGIIPHDAGMAAFQEHWTPATHTGADVAPLLAELRGRGLRLGVLSSTAWPASWHEEILRRDGVLDAFDGCVWSSDLRVTKPHPDAFRAAMAAVGVTDPARCVFVGDRPYDDISGAKAVGMRAVLVPHSDIPPEQQVPVDVEPDAVLHRLADLPAVLDRWSASRP